jgi:hypothetical protein
VVVTAAELTHRSSLEKFESEMARTRGKFERPQVFRVMRERPELHLRREEAAKQRRKEPAETPAGRGKR